MKDNKRLGLRLLCHLNGGSEWSEIQKTVTLDGDETEMVRITRTNGRPQYKVTVDVLTIGEDELDIRKCTTDAEIFNWIWARLEPTKEKPPAEAEDSSQGGELG